MTDPAFSLRRRHRIVALACVAFVAGMVGAAYAAVPFYNWFCRATGFGGVPQIATAAPGTLLDRTVEVRFDANVMPGLPWRFEPERTAISVRLGEVVTAYYKVTNESARETVGQASYNVSPPTAGALFNKINCFCFTEQRMKPGETREMAVVFYVDPAFATDSETAGTPSITLSYTFYSVRQPPGRPLAAGNDRPGAGPI